MSVEWLPELVLLEDFHGDWHVYLERIHDQFLDDFIRNEPTWPGKRVGVKRHPEHGGKSATFWHFISDGTVEAERLPNLRRCERIGWPRPMMDEYDGADPLAGGSRVRWWKEARRGEDRYLLAPEDFSYIVVIADRGDYVLPWTAYWIDFEHQRRKRERAYREYWETRKS